MKGLLKTTLLMANVAVFGIGLQGPATAQDLVADSQRIPFHSQHHCLQSGIKRARHGSQSHQSAIAPA